MTNTRAVNSDGVTLVELMIVLVIVAVGILTLSAVQTHSSRDVTVTALHTRALSLGQTQLEVARVAGFAAAQADSGVDAVFNWRTQVDTISTGLAQVRVTVAWNAQGAPRTLELTTLLSTR